MEEKVISTVCNSHCGGACLLKLHVKDGVITRIETDDGAEPQLRACLKGRAYRQRVYAPDRLKYPLKRVGERGEGKFQRVSWDEAFETVAKELLRVRDAYGPAAIFVKSSAGDIVYLHSFSPISKLLCLLGGFSSNWGYNSYEQGMFAELATFGSLRRSSRDDLLNSRFIILWACDPANSVHGTNTMWYLIQARDRGARIVTVDPRFTDSSAILAKQWIPIIPGADSAMMVAMAYVIIKEKLFDQKFLDAYTMGFDKFRNYVTGVEDGIAKTPAWAEAITSVPAKVIEELARDYATLKPAALITGISAGRTAGGEQYHRAAITLAAMTGNIGVSGGSSGGRSWSSMQVDFYELWAKGSLMPEVINPIEQGPPPFKNFLPIRKKYRRGTGSVSNAKVGDALLRGKAGGYPNDYKLLLILNANYPTQYPDINKAVAGLKKLEFVVTVEQFMTPAAKWADIVLPSCTFMERNDIAALFLERSDGGGGVVPCFAAQNQAVNPIGESRSQLEIAIGLAKKLGLKQFEGIAEAEVLKNIAGKILPDATKSSVPDYAALKEKTVHKIEPSRPYIAYQKEINDPARNPFPTPSGKIEIYSPQLAGMNDPALPPVPKYVEMWEGRSDPLAAKYPLQLLTIHTRRRAHTQNETIPWLRETQQQEMQISPADALARGIAQGDMVKVFNDRGATVLPASITQRIMKGVVTIPQGAWYDPDKNGVDRSGGSNVLLRDESSPGGGFITNTCLVQVEKAK